MTLDELTVKYPAIANLGPARKQGIRLLLALDWRLDRILSKPDGRSLFCWSRADTGGIRDAIHVYQNNLKPMDVVRTVSEYEFLVQKAITEVHRSFILAILGEEPLE